MRTADEHLEEALSEYNEKVSQLELGGPKMDLLEALVNRSTILMLMDSFVSSISDLEEAIELIKEIESDGETIDLGTLIKIYENRGQLCYGDDDETMVSDYSKIAEKLPEITGNIRHYDENDIIEMCIGCSEDLVDAGFNTESLPFTNKAIKMLKKKSDVWSKNRIVESYNLLGQAKKDLGDNKMAISAFENAIEVGMPLIRNKEIDDEMEVVFSYVYKGDVECEMELDEYVEDHENAISLLEDLYNHGRLDDIDLLINLHQGLASKLMNDGDMKSSEHHLLRVMDLGMPAMKDAIIELGLKKNDQ